MITKRSLYFFIGLANALMAVAVIPIRTTIVGQTPVGIRILGPAPSFFGLLALLMLLLSAIRPTSSSTFWMIVIITAVGTLLHELVQNWTSSVFDYLDVMAILCGFFVFCSIHAITARIEKTGLASKNTGPRDTGR